MSDYWVQAEEDLRSTDEYYEGYQARLGGWRSSVCKYKTTTEMFREWMIGYNDASHYIERMKEMEGDK